MQRPLADDVADAGVRRLMGERLLDAVCDVDERVERSARAVLSMRRVVQCEYTAGVAMHVSSSCSSVTSPCRAALRRRCVEAVWYEVRGCWRVQRTAAALEASSTHSVCLSASLRGG